MKAEASCSSHSGQETAATSTYESRFVRDLRELAIAALHRMYVPSDHLFVFRLQRQEVGIVSRGLSPRYTAITILGLAKETQDIIEFALHGDSLSLVCDRLIRTVIARDNVGDLALTLWAAHELGYPKLDPLRERLLSLKPLVTACPTVEFSWVLMAACVDQPLIESGFVHQVARRLLGAFSPNSGVFPHVVGGAGFSLRAHVSCFADFVYPIQSLSKYHQLAGDDISLAAATRCAAQACRTQGPDGQWWWHYDRRTGDVIEGYPVYTVHQHGMGPMALFALEAAGGYIDHDAVSKSLRWLAYSPEIKGSTIDRDVNLIWRKVARREPQKLARRLQAMASFLHPSMRIGGADWMLPAQVVDCECRPYEMGWLLYAWPNERVARWAAL
jgi:hypothetical protein